MRCISLWQPWASLLACGQKRIETRSWQLRLPLPALLAVHAAKKWTDDLCCLCWGSPFWEALAVACGFDQTKPRTLDAAAFLPFGAVVGVVRVAECVPTGQVAKVAGDGLPSWHKDGFFRYLSVGPRERAFGDYSEGRYLWVCDAFYAFPEPIPERGRQSIWDWTPPANIELPGWAKESL